MKMHRPIIQGDEDAFALGYGFSTSRKNSAISRTLKRERSRLISAPVCTSKRPAMRRFVQ
jgi:hypothetical protein